MKASSINEANNFIAGWYIDKSICDNLIEYFEQNPNKVEGKCGSKNLVKKEIKESMDVGLTPYSPLKLIQDYLSELKKVLEEYIKLYPNCSRTQDYWGLISDFQIQRYLPKQGFHKIHCERNGYGQSLNRF